MNGRVSGGSPNIFRTGRRYG